MSEANGIVKQGDFYRELKEIRQDISDLKVLVTQYHGQAVRFSGEQSELKDAIKSLSHWKDEADDRIDALEGHNTKVVAMWGAIGVIGGALIAVIGQYLIASIS